MAHDQLDPILALGLGLYLLTWIVFWGLRILMRLSIEVEEEDLEEARGQDAYRALGKLGVLRTLETVMLIIFAAIMPVAGLVLGMVLPSNVRKSLEQYVGTGTLVGVTLAALFAFGAVFAVFKRTEGSRVMEGFKDLFRAKNKRASVPGSVKREA